VYRACQKKTRAIHPRIREYIDGVSHLPANAHAIHHRIREEFAEVRSLDRYWYELTDGFWGQFLLTQFPHQYAKDLFPREYQHLETMQKFAGALEYLSTWNWRTPTQIQAADGMVFEISALPFSVNDRGDVEQIGVYVESAAVFATDRLAFEYIQKLAKRDLQYRGMRDDRVSCFHYKTEANFLLYRRVRNCADAAEYAYLRQCWDTINRPKYQNKK